MAHSGRPHFPTGMAGGESDQYEPDVVYGENEYSNFAASDSIFGWSWMGRWAENSADAPAGAQAWLEGWVEKFNEAAEAELDGGHSPGTRTEIVIQQFLADLNTQTWWSGDPTDPDDSGVTGQWIAIQKLRYGPDSAPGEYDALVQTYRDHVANVLRGLGYVDADGNLTKDMESPEITALIEGAGGLIYTAGSLSGDLPQLAQTDLEDLYRLTERHFLTERTFDTVDGAPAGLDQLGAGQLQDTYNWIKGLANNNFTPLDDEEIWDMVFRLKREEITQQGVWDRIAGHVGDRYGFLEGSNILNRINQFSSSEDTGWGGGSNLKTHLIPVRDAVASTWGLQKGEVKLDQVFGEDLDTLTIADDNAPHGERFMNSREARRWAREQPQFKQTEEYGTGMQSMVQAILKMFGAH